MAPAAMPAQACRDQSAWRRRRSYIAISAMSGRR